MLKAFNTMNAENNFCAFCGETKFEVRDGYNYCLECGTRGTDAPVRQVDDADEFDSNTLNVKQKIKIQNTENERITSWECYNFILVGMVEDLLGLGAKEELKKTTLRLWAAYLRRLEVAFYSKNEGALPKLGARYYRRDAEIVYKLKQLQKEKKERVRTQSRASETSEAVKANRALRKAKRKLDASVYSTSEYSETDASSTNNLSEQSFSSVGVDSLKKGVPFERLLVDEPRKKIPMRELDHFCSIMATLCNKQLYAILCIALNFIEDDIQLVDLIRYTAEEHVSSKYVKRYLPEGQHKEIQQLLTDIAFNAYPHTYSDEKLRNHVGYMARFLGIDDFIKTDIRPLVKRYVLDLSLPEEFAEIAINLINIYPPEFRTRAKFEYPAFEARAMAYVIFVMKLFFGIDGKREYCMSESAQAMNKLLNQLSTTQDSSNQTPQKELFVWTEWQRYVKMRTIIISQHNASFAKQHQQEISLDHKINILCNEVNCLDDDEEAKYLGRIHQQRLKNFQTIFQPYSCDKEPKGVLFVPSLTPGHSYFNDYLETTEQKEIPKFMQTEHKRRTLCPFVDAKPLENFLSSNGYSLALQQVAVNRNSKYVGVFHCGRDYNKRPKFYKADFTISKAEWFSSLEKVNIRNLHEHSAVDFKRKLTFFDKKYLRTLFKKKMPFGSERGIFNQLLLNLKENSSRNNSLLRDALQRKKNNYGVKNTTETENMPTDVAGVETELKKITLLTPNMDYWTLFGSVAQLQEADKRELRAKLTDSFDWLLDFCAKTIGIDMFVLYGQLLVIEMMFTIGIQDLEEFKCNRNVAKLHPLMEINRLMDLYRKNW